MITPINHLRNLGPTTTKWLAAAGINSREELEKTGAIDAYIKLREANPKVTFLALIAMYAALQDRDWREVTADEKELLREMLAQSENADP